MAQKRVVVTGLGIVSCFGTDIHAFYEALLRGESGVGPIDSFDVSEYPTRFAASIRNFDMGDYLDKKQARRIDPFIAYGIVAGKRALEDAGFDLRDLNSLDKNRCGVIIGSGMGGMGLFSDGVLTVREKGFKRLTPFFIPYIITNMAGAMLSMEVDFRGPNYSISTACASSNHAINAALNHIRKGEADLILCGGSEASVNQIGLAGFVACKALSERNDACQQASRPWDKGRDGFVMGEGSAVLVLESLEHALKRGATIYAEVAGAAVNADAYHLTSPRPDGEVVSECMRLALQDAGVKPQDINYINAHATSTVEGDLCELRAIKKTFQGHTSQLWINCTKSLIGHCLGAAGGMEAVATILSMKNGQLHPNLNLEDPEEETQGLNMVNSKQPQPLAITGAMSNSFGFGGHNSCVVFTPYA